MKIKKDVNVASRSAGFGKDAPNNLSGQDYIDFTLADSVLHFNDGKRKHASIFSKWDWMLVFILTFIILRATPAGYIPARKGTRKANKD